MDRAWYNSSCHSRFGTLFVSRQRAVNLSAYPATVTSSGNSRLAALCVGDVMKRCKKCGKVKLLTQFRKDKRVKSGIGTWCKQCESERVRKYSAGREEQKREYDHQYHSEHIEERNERSRLYSVEHKEQRSEWGHKYRAMFRELINERKRKSREKHAEKARESNRRYYAEHPEKSFEHSQRRRALKKGNGGTITAPEWQALKEFYCFTCLRCGKKEPEIKLTLDHVIPLSPPHNGPNIIENAQPLCGVCNSSKNAKHIDYRK